MMPSSPASSKATKDGEKLLRKFSATKKRRNSGSRLDMSVGDLVDDLAYNDALFGGDDEDMDIDNPSFDHAVAEGSLVAQLYSAKKNGAMTPVGSGEQDSSRSDGAISMLRQALHEVQELEFRVKSQGSGGQNSDVDTPTVQDGLPAIARLLQDLEGQLEAEAAASVSKKIIFSPSSSKGEHSFGTPNATGANSSSSTPASNTKEVLKVYMKNQLDLQESEWEAYEETFNHICEQLDEAQNALAVVTAERDELLAQQSEKQESAAPTAVDGGFEQLFINLKQDYESQSELLVSMEAQFSSAKQELTVARELVDSNSVTISNLNMSLQTELAKVQTLETALQAQQSQLQKAISSPSLQRHTPQKEKGGSSVKEKVDLYENHIFHHSTSSPSTSSSNDKGVLQNYMQNQLELQENEWADYEEMVNAVAEKLEETELSLEKCENEKIELEGVRTELEIEIERLKKLITKMTDDSATEIAAVTSAHQNVVAGLEDEISELKNSCVEKDSTIEELRKSLENRSGELDDVRNLLQNDVKELEKELQSTTDLLSQKTNEYLLLEDESRKQLMDLESQLDNVRAEAAAVAASTAATVDDSVRANDNLVDELRNQIEDLTSDMHTSEIEMNLMSRENEVLLNQNTSLTDERDNLLSQIEEQSDSYRELREDNESKINEIVQLNSRVDELQSEITEVTATLFSTQAQVDSLKEIQEASLHEYEQLSKQYNDEVANTEKLENELDQLKLKYEGILASPPASPSRNRNSDTDNRMDEVVQAFEKERSVYVIQLEELAAAKKNSEAEMKKNMTLVNSQFQSLKVMLSEKDDTIAEKDDIISKKEFTLSERDRLITEREDLLADKTVELQDEQKRNAQFVDIVKSLESQISDMTIAIAAKDEQLAADADTIADITQRLAALEQQSSAESSPPVPPPIDTSMQSHHLERLSQLETANQALNDSLASKDAIILRMKSLFAQSLDPLGETNFYGDSTFTQSDADVVSPTKGNTPRTTPRSSPMKVTSTGSPLQHSNSMSQEDQIALAASLEDAERVIQAMEKKLRVQIHHLQSLQDTLSEEKRKSAYLADHKRQLLMKIKEMEDNVHQLEDQIQENKLDHVDLTRREVSAQRALDEEKAKCKVLETQLMDVKVQLSTNMALIEDLQSNNSQLRVDVEEKQFNSEEFRQEAKNEADSIQLTSKCNSIQQELNELEAVNDALKANLEHKSQYASDLVTEVNELRSLITEKDDELEQLRASDLKEEANLRTELLEKERIIDKLNQIISRLEEHKSESELLLAERLQKLHNEQEINSQLRSFLTIIDEKESTTEELLYQIQMSESSMASQLNETSNLFVAEKETSKRALADMAIMKSEYEILASEFEKFKNLAAMEKTTAEENRNILNSQLDASDSMVSEKNNEIETLRSQNIQLQEEISSWEHQLSVSEREHKSDAEAKAELGRSIISIVDEFTYASKRQDQTAQNLENSVAEWLDMYEDRVKYLTSDAERLKGVLTNQKDLNEEQAKHSAELKRVMESSDEDRSLMEARFSKLQQENESLREKLSVFEKTRLELAQQLQDKQHGSPGSPQSSRHHAMTRHTISHTHSRSHGHTHTHSHGHDKSPGRWQDMLEQDRALMNQKKENSLEIDDESVGRSVGSHSHAHSLTEDFSRLTEKFELTEKRALEMSAHGARFYAKTMKGMALLEGENAKLRALIDHFRIVNAKLMGDVYAATSTAGDASGLKQRFDILEQQYLEVLSKVEQLEIDVVTKDQQLSSLTEESQLQLEKKNEDHDVILREERQNYRVMEESLSFAEKTSSQLQEMNQLLEKRVEREIQIASEESDRLNSLITVERQRASESDNLVVVLQAAIVELEVEKERLDGVISLRDTQHKETVAELERFQRAWEGTDEKRRHHIQKYEVILEEQKQQILSDSNKISDQENCIASLTETLQFTEDELQEKQQQFQDLEHSIEALTSKTYQQEQKINDLVQFLDEAREQATISADECSTALSKTLKVEEKLRQVTNTKLALEKTIEELTHQKETAVNTVSLHEHRIEDILEELAQSRSEVEALSAEVLERNGDLNTLNVSHDARGRELNAKDHEIQELQKEINSLKAKCVRLSEVEALLKSQDEDLSSIARIESHLVTDMQAVISRLEAVLGRDGNSRDSVGGGMEQSPGVGMHDIRSPMGDLLYTPLKSLLTPSRDLLGAVNRSTAVYSHHASPPRGEHRDESNNSVSNAQLVSLRNNFNRLIQMADEHLYRSARLEDSSRGVNSRISEMTKRCESLDQKNRILLSDKESLQQRLQSSENEVESIQDELDAIREERDNAVHAGEDHAQWLRLLRRDIEATTSHESIETVLKAAEAQHEVIGSTMPATSTRDKAVAAELSFSMIEYSQNYPLHDNVSIVKNTIISLVKALYTSTNTLGHKESTLRKKEQEFMDLQLKFENEKRSLTEETNDVIELLNKEKALAKSLREELNSFLAENDNLKAQLNDVHQAKIELEDENVTLKDTIKDLRHAVKDAEVLCVELRSKIRQLMSDKEHIEEDLALSREEMSISMRRVSDLEVQIEHGSLNLSRVKSERDALSNVKMQLTHELEILRRDLAAAASRESKPLLSNEDLKATFELERLLAALGATLDHLHVTMDSRSEEGENIHDDSFSITDRRAEEGKAEDKSTAVVVTLSHRVECAVKRLAGVRTWSRDERRHKRTVEETLNNLRAEVDRLKCTHTLEVEESRELIHELQAKEHNLLIQTTSLTSLKTQNQEFDREITRLKKERDELNATIASNKHLISTNQLSIQAKEQEIAKLKHTHESDNERIGDLKDNVMQLQSELDSRQILCDQQDASIRGLKASSQRQKETIERLEGIIARNKKEKEEMEKKLRYKKEGNESQNEEVALRIRALEVELRETKQSHRKEITTINEKLHAEESETSAALSTIVVMEEKNSTLTTEVSSLRKDLLVSSQEIDRLRTRLDKELSEHRGSQSSLSAVQALEADWRQTAEECQVLREEAEAKLEKALDRIDEMEQAAAEAEDNRLKTQKEFSTFKTEHHKMQHTIEQLTLQLERSQRELQSATSRGSALRTEGRQIRSEVLAAVEELKEVSTVLHSLTVIDDENYDGEESKREHQHIQSSLSEQPLGETLGSKQLHEVIHVIHHYIQQIKKYPNVITTTQTSLRKCEVDNSRLMRELESIETIHADRIQRLHSELQHLEGQLQDRASYDVSQGSSFAVKLKELQEELYQVKQRAQAREEEFKEEVELITSDKLRIEGYHVSERARSMSNSYDSHSGHRPVTSEQSYEIESLTSQLNSAHKEIDAIRHHRSVLQSTVSELETLVYHDSSPVRENANAILRSTKYEGSQHLEEAAEYVESLSNEVNTLKRRLAGAEKLSSIYRTALLALYVDGSFYDSLPVNTGVRDSDNDGQPLGLGWIEKDVSIITAAYVEDIQILQREVADWQFQVKQGDTYRSELRARLEDTLKALYRAGKGETSSMLAHQLEHLSNDLKQSSAHISHLTQELMEAQEHKHHHVDKLTEELVRVQQSRDDFIKETRLKDRDVQRQLQNIKTEKQAIQVKLDKAVHELQHSSQETAKQRQHLQEQTRVISNLRQELIRSDNQLETLKRQSKQQKLVATTRQTTTTTSARATSNSSNYQMMSVVDKADVIESTLRPPPTPPTRTRYNRGLEESVDGVDVARSIPLTSTPPRASSTSRLARERALRASPSATNKTSSVSTPDRGTRSKSAHQSRPVMSPSVSSPIAPPAVVRVRTSRAHQEDSTTTTMNRTSPSRRRPSLESIGSNSAEKPAYSSTRSGNIKKR